jgi:hypothetical protein
MESDGKRRSDRVVLELPILVSGTDCLGEAFVEQTHTLLLSRHGAKIVLRRKLVPDQEISIRCHETGQESDARIVGQIGGNNDDGFFYGVELLDLNANLWGIEFPTVDESENAVGRVLLECMRCHNRVLTYLNEFEAEVLDANRHLSRYCKKCTDMSLWRETRLMPGEKAPEEEAKPASAGLVRPQRTRNDRKYTRLDLKVKVCIRAPQYGEEIAVTENVSRGGFRFHSSRHYREGWLIEAALPYSRTAANIFAAARIVYAAELPDGTSVYGVQYVPKTEAWPRR